MSLKKHLRRVKAYGADAVRIADQLTAHWLWSILAGDRLLNKEFKS